MKIRSSKELKESMKNLDNVVNFKDDEVEVHSDMDIVMTAAYDEDIKAEEHIEQVKSELDKNSEDVIPQNPEAPMPEVKPYTDQLKLDESLSDFDLTEARKRVSARDENDTDKYLDYDMFEFVYELLAAGAKGITNIAPKTPVVWRKKVTYRKNKDGVKVPAKEVWGWFPMQKFMAIGSDDASYGGENEGAGVPQISVEDNDVIIYSNDLDDLKQAADGVAQYQIKCGEPRYKLNDNSHWDYSMKVFVPVYSDGEIMLMSDYLEDIGMSVEDVMPPANAKSFRKQFDKADAASREVTKKVIYDKHVNRAFNDPDMDLNFAYDEMCKEMAKAGIECDAAMRHEFMIDLGGDE